MHWKEIVDQNQNIKILIQTNKQIQTRKILIHTNKQTHTWKIWKLPSIGIFFLQD